MTWKDVFVVVLISIGVIYGILNAPPVIKLLPESVESLIRMSTDSVDKNWPANCELAHRTWDTKKDTFVCDQSREKD